MCVLDVKNTSIQYKKQLNLKLFKTKQQLKQTICFTQIYLKLNRCNLECKILRVLNILRNLADTLFETNKDFPKAKPDLALPNKLDILLDIPETLSIPQDKLLYFQTFAS